MNFFGLINCGICGTVSVIILSLAAIWLLHQFYTNSQERKQLALKRKKKQRERELQFQEIRDHYVLTEENEEIVAFSFSELRQKLQNRDLTCEQVLKAFIAKSIVVQDEFNCITEFVQNARKKAKELDQMGQTKGPLHGIPFCVKDDTNVEGMDSTCGFSALLYKPAVKSAVIVQVLESLGAIAFCRTNVPQSCLSIGSENPIFGSTLNPLNKKLGPGGSSSGTACLVAAGGCHFGIGTDSGGSLRIPAHCCGLSTLRATFNRLSDEGCLHCSPILSTVPGILIKRAQDLGYLYELMINQHNRNPLDVRVPRIAWDKDAYSSKKQLRIGYFTTFTSIYPIGDISVVTARAKSHLEKLGHTLVPIEMPDHARLWISSMTEPTVHTHFLRSTKNDKIADCVSLFHKISLFSPLLYQGFKIYTFVCKTLRIKTEFGHEFPLFLDSEKEAMAKAIFKKMENLDLLLSPAFPFVAMEANQMAPMSFKLRYAMLYPYVWNLVNFPAGVCKFGKESGNNWPTHDPIFTNLKTDSVGMPIGVQVIGKPFQEEHVLRIMAELDQANL